MKTNLALILFALSLSGYSQSAPEYGAPISLETAKKVATAAEAFAKEKRWNVAIVIVDSGSNLVLVHKLDNTQLGSIDVALGKATTANNFKRPTKAFEDAIGSGGVGARVLSLPGAVTIEGGEPIVVDGKIVGAIGVSGVQATQDADVARAGLAALNK